jgi:hypothetical protein
MHILHQKNCNMQHVNTTEMKICAKNYKHVGNYLTTQLNIPATWLQVPQISGDVDRLLGTTKLTILCLFFSTREEAFRRQDGALATTYEQLQWDLTTKESWFRYRRRSTQPTVKYIPWDFLTGAKLSGSEADHTPPSSAKIKNEWSFTFTPPMHFHRVFSDKYTFTFETA